MLKRNKPDHGVGRSLALPELKPRATHLNRRKARFEQEPHLQALDPPARGVPAACPPSRSCRARSSRTRSTRRLAIKCSVERRQAFLGEQGPGRLRQRSEHRMPADAAEPVGGVARVGLAPMGDPVPVSGGAPLSPIVGLLGGIVAGVPEVVHLQAAPPPSPAASDAERSGTLRPGPARKRAGQPGTARLLLHQGRAKRLLVAQGERCQRRDQIDGRQATGPCPRATRRPRDGR